MPEFWLDSNSLITPYRNYYAFDIVPAFWAFLERKGREGIIASCHNVYVELEDGLKKSRKGEEEDDLLKWAKIQRGRGFFVSPDESVQVFLGKISDYVNGRYPPQHAQKFLRGADPWVIAHAKAQGGKVVTIEVPVDSSSKKPKIPNVCTKFGVEAVNIFKVLRVLNASLAYPDVR